MIHPDAYKSVDGKMPDGMEMVFFFTDYLNHIGYNKFIAAVRDCHIPFSYLHGRNIELVIKQVYEAMEDKGKSLNLIEKSRLPGIFAEAFSHVTGKTIL